MNYLFFKTAVSSINDGSPTICQFGYVLSDASFNILEKDTIYINPEVEDQKNIEYMKFSVKDSSDIATSYAQYPTFKEVADRIYGLLTREDTQVVSYEAGLDCLALSSCFARCEESAPNAIILELINLSQLFQGRVGTLKRRLRYLGYSSWDNGVFVEAEGYAFAECELLKRLFNEYNCTYDDLYDGVFDCCFPYFEDQVIASRSKILFNVYKDRGIKSLDLSKKKHYLFFDLECSNCKDGVGKICEFGAVLTDTDFNVEEKYNWLMNPESPFMLQGRNGQPDLELYYSEYQYNSSPTYPSYYSRIKALLEREDILVFGHSVDNDISFLETDSARYELGAMSFDAVDTQTIYACLSGSEGKRTSLEDVIDEVCPGARAHYYEHRAVDDSGMTMEICRSMLKRYEKTLEEIISLYPHVMTTSRGYIDTFNNRLPAIKQFKEFQSTLDRRHNLPILDAAIEEDEPRIEEGSTTYSFTGDAKFSVHDLSPMVEDIHDGGGLITNSIKDSSYVVCLDEEDYEALKKAVHFEVRAKPVYLEK